MDPKFRVFSRPAGDVNPDIMGLKNGFHLGQAQAKIFDDNPVMETPYPRVLC